MSRPSTSFIALARFSGASALSCSAIAASSSSVSQASTFIEVLEKRQGLKVACLEGIAYRQGWITAEQLRENAQPMLKNDYGKYLLSILEEKDQTLKKNLEY